MKPPGIISRGEALKILKNDLRRTALEKHASELASATAKEQEEIIGRIDQEIEKELRRRTWRVEPGSLIH